MILITGLGPGDLARIPRPVLDILLDERRTLIVRTAHHPAASQISHRRDVIFCDDLYESGGGFESVYTAIADRVLTAAEAGPVVYAVPGGPTVGEFAVREILARAPETEVLPAETFVDAILRAVGYDALDRGLQILNGHDLPTPLVIDKPTIVGHLDRPEVLADVAANLSRVMPEDTVVRVLAGVGSDDAVDWSGGLEGIDPGLAGFRTSMWIDARPGGLIGAVRTMKRLRAECPWDREQTHASLTKYLVEEAFELIEAIGGLGDGDLVAAARVEEEVGDVLLQVLFQAAIASEEGLFDIDDAAEVLRQKLERRHPHVFGDVEVADAAEVKSNWDAIKVEEKGGHPESIFDGVPQGMPALHRASKVQNRAAKAGHEMPDSRARLVDSIAALTRADEVAADSLGQALFDLVDLGRHFGIDSEMALRSAIERFQQESGADAAAGPGEQHIEKTGDSP